LRAVRLLKKAANDNGGVPSGAHGATNKEHHVCARRRVGEAAGSPLRILSSKERKSGKGASWRAGVGRVECWSFSAA
jgi:hypothetical protein